MTASAIIALLVYASPAFGQDTLPPVSLDGSSLSGGDAGGIGGLGAGGSGSDSGGCASNPNLRHVNRNTDFLGTTPTAIANVGGGCSSRPSNPAPQSKAQKKKAWDDNCDATYKATENALNQMYTAKYAYCGAAGGSNYNGLSSMQFQDMIRAQFGMQPIAFNCMDSVFSKQQIDIASNLQGLNNCKANNPYN